MGRFDFIDEPTQVLAEAADFLAGEPVLTTVLATVTARAAADDAAGVPRDAKVPRWWCLARDSVGAVVGMAMRTTLGAPYPIYVIGLDGDRAAELARVLLARVDEPAISAVNGSAESSAALLGEIARHRGGTVVVEVRNRLFEARAVTTPPRPPGGARMAQADDVDIVDDWWGRFHREAAAQAGRAPSPGDAAFAMSREDVARRIANSLVALWENEGRVVSMVGISAPAAGVCRVGPVYTPQQERGKGYAGAAVADLTAATLAEGNRCCLFTDLANPTSNRLYQSIGYEPVTDMVALVLHDGS